MYWCKKEDVAIVIAVALLFLVTGIFFFSEVSDGSWFHSSRSWFTGAAVRTIEEVGVPTEGAGVPEREDISVPESTVGAENLTEEVSNENISEEAIAENNIQPEISSALGVSNIGDGQITGAINLSTGAYTTFNGVAASDGAGKALAVGDINGDGHTDIIIGAPDATVNGITNAGAVYVVYGSGTLSTTFNLSIANVTFYGHNNSAGLGSRVGYSLATGNFNNDSYTDLAIGAYAGGTSVRSGRVYLIYGGSTMPPQFNLSDTGGNMTLKGITSSDSLGSALAMGDVNGDGIDDLLVGAKGAINHSGEYQSGEAYIVYGSSTVLTGTLNSTQTNVTLFVHESSAALADKKGLTTGDVNQDGYDDILVAGTNEGSSYFVYGSTTLPTLINLSNSANLTIESGSFDSVIIGDINGDGFPDLVGGDPIIATGSGRVYVYYGTTTLSGTISFSTNYNVTLRESSTESFGSDVGLADFNKDSFTDLVVGAPNADANGQNDSGKIYLFYGPLNYTVKTTIYSNQSNATFNGIDAGDYTGAALVAGNINDDGFGDLLIGAYGASPNSNVGSGKSYLYYGQVACTIVDRNITLNQNINVNGSCFIVNTSNIILNGSGYSLIGDGSGIGINVSGVNNVVITNIILQNFSNGVYVERFSNNTLIRDSPINSIQNDTFLTINGSINATFINVTHSRERVFVGADSTFSTKWYVDVYVNDSSGNPLSSVAVYGYNISGAQEQNTTTTLGDARLTLTEFTQNGSTKLYQTNHTINVTKNLYSSSTQRSINLTTTNSTSTTFTMDLSCGVFTSNITLSPVTLNQNGSCFTVGASNLVIDGAGIIVRGNGSGIGINITGYNNTQLSNFTFHNFSEGIYLGGTNNSNFTNLFINISTNKDVLASANGGINNVFINSTFNRTSVSLGENSTILVKWPVTVRVNNSGFVVASASVFATNSSGGLEVNTSADSLGIAQLVLSEFFQNGTARTYYTPHNITTNKSGYTTSTQQINLTQTNGTAVSLNILGIPACGALNYSVTFQNSTLSTNGTCFNVTASNLIIDGNNTIMIGNVTAGENGFRINSKQNVTILNFDVQNFTNGIRLQDAHNNSFVNVFLNNNVYGIKLTDSDQNNFNDSNISSIYSNIVLDFFYTDYVNYLTNVTMDKNSISEDPTGQGDDTEIIMRWYIDVQVNDTSDNPLVNVTLSAYKADGTLEDAKDTTSDGRVRLTLSEFSRGAYGYTYITPHTIVAFKPGYYQNSTTVDISATNNTRLNLTLEGISCGVNLVRNITLGQNLTSNGTCFTFVANNITIDGNGYYLIGNNSGIGVNLSERNGINITNLKVTNYTYGLSMLNSNSSIFSNVQATNNTYGIFINQSNDNRIYDSVFANNSASNIFVTNDGNTNNSLINVSVNINTINVTGTATVFKKWYATVNVTFGSGYPLGNTNVTGYFNTTREVDHSIISNSEGIARLELSELKKNASGVYNLTPHNVTAFFNSSSGYSANSTTFNISLTNNTNINLSLSLNCTAPYNDMRITQNTVLCPGTWTVPDTGSIGVIRIQGNYNLTCDSTILRGNGRNYAFYFETGTNGVTISGCTVDDYDFGIAPGGGACGTNNLRVNRFNATRVTTGISAYSICENFTLANFSISPDSGGTGLSNIYYTSNKVVIENGIFSGGRYGIHFASTGGYVGGALTNTLINNVTFRSGMSENTQSAGIINLKGNNITIKNSTFDDNKWGIYISDVTNTSIYYNNFDSSYTYHIYNTMSSSPTLSFNISINGTPQGNSWDDFCDLSISDTNGDGYGDSGADYPYNSTHSTKFYGPGNDYGPKVISCPSPTPSGSGGGRSTAVATSTPAVTPTVTTTTSKKPPPPQTELPADAYTPEEAKKFIKTTNITTTKLSSGITAVTITLENTGTKKMYLFPELQQEIDDPYFIITRKTLGFGDSLLMKLSQIVSSGESISGRLLKAEVVNPEEIVLNPGEKIDRTIEIKEGLAQPRQMKMQFATNGVSVNEKEFQLEKKSVLGTAVDLDASKKTLDLYAVIVPPEKIGGIKPLNSLTGAFIGPSVIGTEQYFLELEVIKENADGTFNTKFNELYGPYSIKQTEPLIFAQQLKYGEKYAGKHIIRTKIYQGLSVAAENEFGVDMG